MRAAEKALVSPTNPAAARALLLRVAAAVLATTALLLVWHPVVVHAQSAAGPVQPATVLPDGMQPPAPAKQPPKDRSEAKQDSATKHVVKAGETLWSIATRYYGDGQQWRAVARRNGIALSNDTAVRVGTVLVMPSRRTVASAVSARPAPIDTTTPKAVMTPAGPPLPPPVQTIPVKPSAPRPTGALATQTAGKADAPGTRPVTPPGDRASRVEAATPKVAVARDVNSAQDTAALSSRSVLRPQIKAERLLTNGASNMILVEDAELRAARASREVTTVFLRQVPTEAEAVAASQRAMGRAVIEPRWGEYAAAPYAIDESRWRQAGTIMRRIEGAARAEGEVLRIQLADEIEITAPSGVTLAVGDRLVAVRNGGRLREGVSVAVPTGVLQVTQVEAGKPVRAVVRSESAVVEEGEALLMLEGAPAPIDLRATREAGADVETVVAWLDAAELLPTLQSYLLLGAGEAQGVKAGEEFALVQKNAAGADERIALVRVVRAGALGSSAVVIGQSQPKIAAGVMARRIARVP